MSARTTIAVVLVAVLAIAGAALAQMGAEGMKGEMKGEMMEMPFGGEADVAFAEALWKAMDGYADWLMQSDIIPGKSPHGMFVRMYYNIVTVDGKPYHVVVKDNYGGEGVTLDTVRKAPADHLMAVTTMVQREPGYDPEDNDWFYVKYAPDGTIGANDMGAAMAGRVAKGMPVGCIACHAVAGGGDFFYSND